MNRESLNLSNEHKSKSIFDDCNFLKFYLGHANADHKRTLKMSEERKNMELATKKSS